MRSILILVFLFLLCPETGFAKSSAPNLALPAAGDEGELTTQDIDQFIRTIEDPVTREQFIKNLNSLREVQKKQAAASKKQQSLGELLLAALSEKVESASELVGKLVGEILEVPGWLQRFGEIAMDPQALQRGMEILLKVLAILGAAWLAQKGAARLLRTPRLSLETRMELNLPLRVAYSLLHFLFDLIPLAVFGLTAQLVLPLTYPSLPTKLTALTIVNANLLARGLNILGCTIFMPHIANLRVPRLTDRRAEYIVTWWRRFAYLVVYSYFFFGLGDLLDMPPGLLSLLQQAIGLVIAILALTFVIQNRLKVARSIKSSDLHPSPWVSLRNRFAETWHIFASLYIFALYAIWALGLPGGFQFLIRATLVTGLVFALTRLVAELVSRLILKSFSLSSDLQGQMPGLERRVSRYMPILLRLVQILIYALAFFILAEAWGIDAIGFLSSSAGKRIADALGSILVVLFIAALTWEGMNAFIDHWLANHMHESRDRRQRLQTLLPLLRNAVRLAIFIMVGLIVLSQVGINIAPLLAGAGVIGLAVGFGAQTLVKDIITGLFIIAEDTIAIGDVVEIDGHEGKVEGMTIRTIRLRDDEGAVHTLPYSFIEAIRNKSKDYSNVIVEVPFKKAADYDKLVKIMEEVGQELKAGPLGKFMLSDLQVQGVSRLGEGATSLRARIRVSPGRQRPVSRGFNLAFKNRLDQMESGKDSQ